MKKYGKSYLAKHPNSLKRYESHHPFGACKKGDYNLLGVPFDIALSSLESAANNYDTCAENSTWESFFCGLFSIIIAAILWIGVVCIYFFGLWLIPLAVFFTLGGIGCFIDIK